MELQPGANAPVDGEELRLTVYAQHDVAIGVLFVDADGHATTTRPVLEAMDDHAAGVHLVRSANAQPAAELHLDLPAVPSEVDRIIVYANYEHHTPSTQTTSVAIGAVAGTAEELSFTHQVQPGILTDIIVETYRRAAQWKIRAMGQGYAQGQRALFREYGLDTENDTGTATHMDGEVIPHHDLGDVPPDLKRGEEDFRAKELLSESLRVIGNYVRGVEISRQQLANTLDESFLTASPRQEHGSRRHQWILDESERRLHHDVQMLQWEAQVLADQWPTACAEYVTRDTIVTDTATFQPGTALVQQWPYTNWWRDAAVIHDDLPYACPTLVPITPDHPIYLPSDDPDELAQALANMVGRLAVAAADISLTVAIIDHSNTLFAAAELLAPFAMRPAAATAAVSQYEVQEETQRRKNVLAGDAVTHDTIDSVLLVVISGIGSVDAVAGLASEWEWLASAGTMVVYTGETANPQVQEFFEDNGLLVVARSHPLRIREAEYAGFRYEPAVLSPDRQQWPLILGHLARLGTNPPRSGCDPEIGGEQRR